MRYICINYRPESNGGGLVNHAVGVIVPVSNKELEDDVDEEGNLAAEVEPEELAREAPEEAKLHWSEEGRVYCPSQYEVLPQMIPPTTYRNHTHHLNIPIFKSITIVSLTMYNMIEHQDMIGITMS